MSGKSNKEDIELPLLAKGQRQEADGSSYFKKSHLSQSKPKYFESGLLNRAVFGWVNHFLSVSWLKYDFLTLNRDQKIPLFSKKITITFEPTKNVEILQRNFMLNGKIQEDKHIH